MHLLLLILLSAGCSAAQPAFVWPWWRKGPAPVPREPWPTAAQEWELSDRRAPTRAGGAHYGAAPPASESLNMAPTLAPPAGSAMTVAQAAPLPAVTAAAADNVTVESMAAVIAELQTLDRLTSEQQARLMSELKGTDPALWPQTVRRFRDALAEHAALAAAKEREAQHAQPVPNAAITGVVAAPAAASAAPQGAIDSNVVQASASLPLPAAVPQADAAPQAAPSTEPAAPAAAPPSTAALAAGDWRFHAAAAIGALEAQLAAAPQSPAMADDYGRLRLLYVAAGRHEDALRAAPETSAEQQEFWSKELTGLAAYLNSAGAPEPAAQAAAAADLLDAAQRRLRQQAPLSVRNLVFCTEVMSYGVYTPFAQSHLAPGQEVLLYAEIENLKSECRTEGFYTALESSYEIVDAQGVSVESRPFGLTEETCRNERRDFFIRYQFYLPAGLADGDYTLRLTIRDTLGQKAGQASIPLAIKKP